MSVVTSWDYTALLQKEERNDIYVEIENYFGLNSSYRDFKRLLYCINPSSDYLNPKKLKVRVCVMK